jgi:hypothetical protein
LCLKPLSRCQLGVVGQAGEEVAARVGDEIVALLLFP